MAEKQVDILIVGGGLVGASLLLALTGSGYSTTLVEAQSFNDTLQEGFDARTLALSPASVRILDMLGVWSLLAADAMSINQIHVSEQGRLGATRLKSPAETPLGEVIELQAVSRALYQLLPLDKVLAPAHLTNLDVENGLATVQTAEGVLQIRAKLIVAADGGQSSVRSLAGLTAATTDYGQVGLVTNIGLNRDHSHIAYERFTTSGPLAMLPMRGQRAAMIWSLPPDKAQALLALDDSAFLQALQRAFGYKLGRLAKVGRRVTYPIQQILMQRQTAWPLVFIGNAAHTLHPIAAQGFNLALRDVAALAQCIVQQGLNAAMLEAYQAMRETDQAAIIQFTNKLLQLFGSSLPGLSHLRGLGLMIMDNSKGLKSLLSHYARGYGGIVPDLVCGIPLQEEHR